MKHFNNFGIIYIMVIYSFRLTIAKFDVNCVEYEMVKDRNNPNHYSKFVSVIANGAFGVVYESTHNGQPAAIKIELFPPEEDCVLSNEIEILLDLNSNPNDSVSLGWPKVYDYYDAAFLIPFDYDEHSNQKSKDTKDDGLVPVPCKAVVQTLFDCNYWEIEGQPGFHSPENIFYFIDRLLEIIQNAHEEHRIIHCDIGLNNIGFYDGNKFCLFDWGISAKLNNQRQKQVYVKQYNAKAINKIVPYPYGVKYMLSPKATLAKENRNEDDDIWQAIIASYERAFGPLPWFTAKNHDRWTSKNLAIIEHVQKKEAKEKLAYCNTPNALNRFYESRSRLSSHYRWIPEVGQLLETLLAFNRNRSKDYNAMRQACREAKDKALSQKGKENDPEIHKMTQNVQGLNIRFG